MVEFNEKTREITLSEEESKKLERLAAKYGVTPQQFVDLHLTGYVMGLSEGLEMARS